MRLGYFEQKIPPLNFKEIKMIWAASLVSQAALQVDLTVRYIWPL